MSLRFMLERTLAAVKLSTDIICLEHWLKDKRDLNWASIIDENQGVFSCEFVDAFMPILRDDIKHISGIAQAAYRKCSEYIHGNYTTLDIYPLEFAEDKFMSWIDTFDSIKHCIIFSLLMRYWNELDEDDRIKIESMIIEEFSHMTNLRSVVSYR